MKVRGELTIDLPAFDLDAHPLDQRESETASHFWQPVAPQTRIKVVFSQPQLNWQGSAYVDSNYGDVPLESSLRTRRPSHTHTSIYI